MFDPQTKVVHGMLDRILSLMDVTPAQSVIWVSYVVSTLVGGWGTIQGVKSAASRIRLRRDKRNTRTVESVVTELIRSNAVWFCSCCEKDGLPLDYNVSIGDRPGVLSVCPTFVDRVSGCRVCRAYFHNDLGCELVDLDTAVQNQLCEILDQRYLEYKLKKEA